VVNSASTFFSGLSINGFAMPPWFISITPEEKKHIAENYSKYLKGDLSIKTVK
jgi:hypothetical protein